MVNYGIKVKGIKKTFQSPSIYLSSCARTLCLPLQIYCLLSLFPILSPRRLNSWTVSLGPWSWQIRPIRGNNSRSMGRRRQMLEYLFPAPHSQASASPRVQAVVAFPQVPPGSCLYVLSFSQMVPSQGLGLHSVPVIAHPFPFRLREDVDSC